jgi:hypothetical protein
MFDDPGDKSPTPARDVIGLLVLLIVAIILWAAARGEGA